MASIPRLTPEEVQQSLNWQLIGAIRALDIDRAIRHIKAGADVHAKTFGTTALIVACGASCQEVALYILAMPGINVNATGDNGWTALCLAANTGLTTVVRVLLEKGADLNTICVGSPLYHACGHSHKEIAIRLIAAGADINAGAPNTPIFACGKKPEMAEVLAILNSPDPRATAIKALSSEPVSAPVPNKAELAQQLLRAVQTNNGEEISRLVAAGISLRNLPGNLNTSRRLLTAITPHPPSSAKGPAAADPDPHGLKELFGAPSGGAGAAGAPRGGSRKIHVRKNRRRSPKNRKTRNRKH